MDAEEARRSFAQATLRCLSLEIDRDVETLRAQKFREIILALAGEGADTVPSDGTLAPSGISVCSTLQPLLSYLPRGAPEPVSARTPQVAHPPRASRNCQEEGGVAVAVRQAQQDEAVTASSSRAEGLSELPSETRTRVSQPRTRRRNSTSLGEPAQISKRARISSGVSRPTGSGNRLAPSRETDSQKKRHRNAQRIVPAPSRAASSALSVIQPRGSIDIYISTILKRARLTQFELTRAEADCAAETPDIGWSTFTNLFGGRKKAEWPDCHRNPGYKNFLCANIRAQPYTPTLPGQPGLVLRIPTTIFTPQGDYSSTVHVLSCPQDGTILNYLGEYTRVPLPEVQIEWCDLPSGVRTVHVW
ncbi:hypothetical protein BJV78DRAFT_221534 [Lactifluus subvellereus]|nr:hypothetical protein BJV78DRAFT_221534 [Lactifluus subvellereus]